MIFNLKNANGLNDATGFISFCDVIFKKSIDIQTFIQSKQIK